MSRGVPTEGRSSLAGVEPDGQEIAPEMCGLQGRRARGADPPGVSGFLKPLGAKGQSRDAGARSRLKALACSRGLGCGHLEATASLSALVSHKRVTKSHPVLRWPWTIPEMSPASRVQLGD